MRWLVPAALAAATLALAPSAAAANSIVADSAAPTVAGGVAFAVTAGGGNRNFASVSVSCTAGGAVVYATVLNVPLDAGGAGTSQRIFPPASSCTADLLKQMQIGKSHVLASTSFVVAP